MRISEHSEQCAIFDWKERFENRYPELKVMFAIPNGGHRHILTAMKLKREGVQAGVPDICLPVARKDHHGLFIELKIGKGKPTQKQLEWHKLLKKQGYKVEVCYGADNAIKAIQEYLKSPAYNY